MPTSWSSTYSNRSDQGVFTQEKAEVLIALGYQYIKMMMIYDVKHDRCHHACLVAASNMTSADGASLYSLVVSLQTLRLALLLGELNLLKIMVGNITSAYLMVLSKEFFFFKAGPEFLAKAGHLMVVCKAIYGLQNSGKLWRDLLFNTLLDMGFKPSKADPNIWMRNNRECYEYVCLYVDNLVAIMKDPKASWESAGLVSSACLTCWTSSLVVPLGEILTAPCSGDPSATLLMCWKPKSIPSAVSPPFV
jgi:Reverse transcriptase (RNA-dependent DNA polymerase)